MIPEVKKKKAEKVLFQLLEIIDAIDWMEVVAVERGGTDVTVRVSRDVKGFFKMDLEKNQEIEIELKAIRIHNEFGNIRGNRFGLPSKQFERYCDKEQDDDIRCAYLIGHAEDGDERARGVYFQWVSKLAEIRERKFGKAIISEDEMYFHYDEEHKVDYRNIPVKFFGKLL